jgi:ubiquinone/menaquinone biosynthesis C-methylase UbiE
MKSINLQNNIEMWGNPTTWKKDGDEWSTQFGTTQNMWNEIIYPRISIFLQGDILEIAPGYGRVTEKLLEYNINSLEIVDLNSNCIDRCKERFGDRIQGYFTNSGKDLHDFTSNNKDFILSWDSFVHMDETVVEPYLWEIYRVLKPGAIAWIHHSNLGGGDENNWNNIGGRANMGNAKFTELSQKAGLTVVNQEYFKWESNAILYDGITTLQKPS